ncbi:hypothetical protein BOTBODRAFT_351855 [Botryobasidium botryosum FD-172 SS1]|uniref:Uncharacterized protein n=1 Tax=Botryobasidium botryosum (strain FD-172 SS1) TaxID=930990 RepID=A0A067MHE8_BOTB1|nr:hypothetical protein BOTBODRAFT_351855 [Botryobasidium botryosum FD-172 SS1]
MVVAAKYEVVSCSSCLPSASCAYALLFEFFSHRGPFAGIGLRVPKKPGFRRVWRSAARTGLDLRACTSSTQGVSILILVMASSKIYLPVLSLDRAAFSDAIPALVSLPNTRFLPPFSSPSALSRVFETCYPSGSTHLWRVMHLFTEPLPTLRCQLWM